MFVIARLFGNRPAARNKENRHECRISEPGRRYRSILINHNLFCRSPDHAGKAHQETIMKKRPNAIAVISILAGFAVLPARAADIIPAKPAPAGEYVRICSAAGEGFFTIPGSETCLKIGGYIAADFIAVKANDDATTGLSFKPRARLEFSTYSETGLGPLTSFVRYTITGADTDGDGDGRADQSADEGSIGRAYISLGGFLAGRNISTFEFYNDLAYNVYGFDPFVRVSQSETDQFRYTATFGAFEAAIALETGGGRNAGIFDADVGDDVSIGDGGFSNAWPDLVGRVRYAGEVVSAQIMGALHENRTIGGLGGERFGFAVGAGIAVNAPIGEGATFTFEGTYAQGATSYTGGFGEAADGYVDTGASTITLTKSYSLSGEYLQTWNDSIKTTLFGGYYNANTPAFAALDYSEWIAGANVIWTVVPGLDVIPQYRFSSGKPEGAATIRAHEFNLSIYRYF
jgi:hypothetical protein